MTLQHAVALAGHFPDLGSAQPTPRPTPGYRPPKLEKTPPRLAAAIAELTPSTFGAKR